LWLFAISFLGFEHEYEIFLLLQFIYNIVIDICCEKRLQIPESVSDAHCISPCWGAKKKYFTHKLDTFRENTMNIEMALE
jgi:hypothetical protein